MHMEDIVRHHRKEAFEEAAREVEGFAEYYPVDVFPEDGESTDAKSAAMARHVCKVLAKKLREMT